MRDSIPEALYTAPWPSTIRASCEEWWRAPSRTMLQEMISRTLPWTFPLLILALLGAHCAAPGAGDNGAKRPARPPLPPLPPDARCAAFAAPTAPRCGGLPPRSSALLCGPANRPCRVLRDELIPLV